MATTQRIDKNPGVGNLLERTITNPVFAVTDKNFSVAIAKQDNVADAADSLGLFANALKCSKNKVACGLSRGMEARKLLKKIGLKIIPI